MIAGRMVWAALLALTTVMLVVMASKGPPPNHYNTIAPPGPSFFQPSCQYVVVTSPANCHSIIITATGLSLEDFRDINPRLDAICTNLEIRQWINITTSAVTSTIRAMKRGWKMMMTMMMIMPTHHYYDLLPSRTPLSPSIYAVPSWPPSACQKRYLSN